MPQKTARRNSKHRKNAKLGTLLSNPLFAISLVAAAVLLFILIRNYAPADNGYYCPGVYINSVDMSVYTKDQGETMLTRWTDGLINSEYTLTYEGRTWTFSPKDADLSFNTEEVLSRAWNLGHTGNKSDRENVRMSLKYQPQELWTEHSFNEEKLRSFISGIAAEVYLEPVDADIVITATKPEIVSPSKDGLELNEEALYETLVARMLTGDSSPISVPVEVKRAAVSSNDAESGLQLLVTYTTSLEESTSARKRNVRLALNNFNGFELKVGETASFNEIVGERTVLRGYSEATVYYGASVTTGIGGGICQASSTLYGALLYAGMDIVERNCHTMVVNYCAASMDAAVSDDASQDLIFVNNTDYNIYIFTSVDMTKETATVEIYGALPEYRIELVSTITQNNIKNPSISTVKDPTGVYAYYVDDYTLKSEGKLGRRSRLERIFYDRVTGAEVKRELISEDYYLGERDVYYVGVHPIGRADDP